MAAPGPRWTIRAKLTLIFMVTLLFFSLISAVAFSGILSLSLQQQLRFSLLQTEAQAQKKVQKDLAILASILERQRERVHSSLEALLAQIPPGEFAAQIVAGELARRARVRRLQQVQQYLRLSLLTVTDLEGRVLIRATNPQRYGDSVLAAAPTLEPLWERARQGQATAALGCLPAEVLRFERVLPFTALPGVTRPGDSLVKQVRSPARPRRNAVAKPSLTEVLMYFSVLPVRDERGKAVAVVWAGEVLNHTQHLVDRYHSVVLNSHAAVYLGPLCIATSRTLPNGRRAVGTVMPPPVVQAVLENGQNWQGDLLLPWGEELLTAYQPLRDGQGKIIGALAVGTPRSFFAPVLRALEQSTRLLAARTHHLWATEVVLSLLLALLVAWLVAARLSAPIRKLRAGAQRIGEGDFDYRLRIRTGDELQDLAETFNEMAARLKEAQRSDRLALVGRMASTIIHDLKNPLTIIRGFTPLLKNAHLSEAERDEFTGYVLDASEHITELVEDLLDFARGEEKLNLQPDDLGRFLTDLAPSLEHDLARVDVQFALYLPEDPLPVRLDRRKMQRVVFNLTNNAREALEESGGRFTIEATREDRQAVVRFRDNGPGIPEEIKDRLFEPFVTHGKPNGTGLGLAICKQIVEAHGGRIEVTSPPGQGTEFRVFLPLYAG